MGKSIRYIIFSIILLFSGLTVSAQGSGAYGSYSPYSVYGIGEISRQGNAFTQSMGGIGIATRNRRFINYLNPAAVTARDTLAFMADFGISQKNTYFRQGGMKSANNTFNIYNLVMSFPIWKSSAFMVGLVPFSDVGYDFSSYVDDDIIAGTGNINYKSSGSGGIYQIFIGAGATFWKRFSLGAELDILFGNIEKNSDTQISRPDFRSVNSGSKINSRGVTGKLGLQYEQPLGKNLSMLIGTTYRFRSKMRGQSTDYNYGIQSSVVDSVKTEIIHLSKSGLKFGDELGVGISLKGGEDWNVEFNYIRQDWRKSGMDAVNGFAVNGDMTFKSSVSHSFRAGFEIVPNKNDIRYYLRRCAYRGGFYYDRANYKINGKNVDGFGLTLGVTLPVWRWYNGISLGLDLGQKGTIKNNMVRERYFRFFIGFNIHDIWFQKTRYK